ncbi:MAG: translation initiation factor IF-2 subunit beta [Candidatus Micrarchaeota archaeon]
MAEEYEKLLDKLYSNLPTKRTSGERFEIPVADCFLQGSKTIIRNYGDICSRLRRTPEELSKYLFKELATPGVISGQQLILHSKVNPRLVNEKLTSYCEIYVICRECGKPDTHLDAVDRNVRMLVCEACGAKKPVRF